MTNTPKSFDELMSDGFPEDFLNKIHEGEDIPIPQEEDKPITNKKRNNKEDEDVIYTSFIETHNYIVEQVNANCANCANYNKKFQYLIYDKETRLSTFQDFFADDGKVYKPIVDDLVKENIVLLPTGVEDYGETDDLVKEIKEFLLEYFQVPSFFENFLPYLVLFYWTYEKFPFVPYISFLGRTGTGKSTAMEVLGSICYKPIDASGAITVASIFRVASQWRGTLLLDEFNPGGESYNEMLSLLKSGVANKAVFRVEGERKREVKAYMVKSPKMFTSEKPINDAGLRSRIIEVRMEQNHRPVPLYRQNRYLVKAQELRNKLLKWRLDNLNKIDLSVIEFGYKELSTFQGRVQQVLTPIYYMADDKAKEEILEFAQEQQEETIRERKESMEGQIFEVIYEYYNQGVNPSITAIGEVINKNTKFPTTERKIANAVRKLLGLTVRKMGHENITAVDLENSDDHIQELCVYYGFSFLKHNSHSSHSSQAEESYLEMAEQEVRQEDIPFE